MRSIEASPASRSRGRADTDAAVDVVETILAAAELEPEVAGVVLACFRAGPALAPLPGEEACFLSLRDLCDDVGVELVDWFVVVDGRATSLAELAAAPSCWRCPRGRAVNRAVRPARWRRAGWRGSAGGRRRASAPTSSRLLTSWAPSTTASDP